MPSISDVVNVSITADTARVTRVGFGTPLLLAYHAHNTDLIREYSGLDEMVADSFDADEAAYLMAQAVFSQEPRPETVKIGRLTQSVVPTKKLTITDATEGNHILLSIQSSDGTTADIDYTILAAATTSTVATAVELLIEAVTGISSSASSADITITGAAGTYFWLYDLQGCTQLDQTGDCQIDTDLTAIEVVDSDWYAICCAVQSEANADDIAAWVETRDKLFIAQTSDDLERGASGSLMSGWAALSYDNSACIFTENSANFLACGWVGKMLAKDPGSATWALKTIDGAVADPLTTTEIGYIDGDSGNHYTEIAGVSITRKGVVASGEYIDVRMGIHWLKARIAERVFTLLASADKVPYTDPGVALVVAEIRAQLQIAIQKGVLAADPKPTVTAPKVADIETANRQARLLPDVKFAGTLAGAIHKTNIAGVLSV
jgi:hypothetical protein